MKIILFSYGLVGGGAERIACVICNGLVDRGHNVCIVAHKDIPSAYHLSPDIKQLYYDANSNDSPLIRRWKILRSIRRIVKKENPDVVIGLMRIFTEYLYVATIGLHQKIIAWDHSSCRFGDLEWEAFIRKYFMYALMKRVFVLTEEDKRNVWYKHNIRVMPNALSFSPAIEYPSHKEKVIIGVGNFNNWRDKGFDLLVEAWSLIEKTYPEWKLKIIGGGDKTTIEQLIVDKGLHGRVFLADFETDIKKVYHESSIFVLSSRQEGFSLVMLEAMSQGCACVACDNHNRTKEILGNTGIIYSTGDTKDMAEKISFLLGNQKLIIDMGKLSIERSKHYSIDSILDKWEAELNNLV